MEAKISLKGSKIRILKPGVYLLLFTLGLGSTTFVTGANLLVLMDFLLFSVLIFNFCYLSFLKRGDIRVKFPHFILDSQPFIPQITLSSPLPPFCAVFSLFWQRFDDTLETQSWIVHFSNRTEAFPIDFPIRGSYRLERMRLNIEFPFPILCLDVESSQTVEVVVAPDADNESSDTDYGRNINRTVGGDLNKIAPYIPGDSLKRISWKHSAKFNQLMVKQYDRHNLSEIVFVIQYQKDNEKTVFAQVASKLEKKMDLWEPFIILGQHTRFQFDGTHQDVKGLLLFLARYRSPDVIPSEISLLGISP